MKKILQVRKMAVVGMLAAICVVLGLTGYGFIPLPMAKATILHVPVIIGAILEGPLVGMMIGLIFGLFSIFQNMTAPNALSFAFINPLVSIFPRVLIAVTAYFSYRLAGSRSSFAIGLGAVIGSLTNTVGVLGMIYLLYAAEFAAARGMDAAAVLPSLAGIAVMYGVPEAFVSALITIPVVLSIRRLK